MTEELERIYQLPAGTSVTDTSFFADEDSANSNVTQKLSALQVYTYLLTKLALANLSVVTLNVSNTGASSGGIKFNNSNFINNYGTLNTFVGSACGNVTLTTGSAVGNTGIGANTLTGLTIGSSNTAVGNSVLDGCTSGVNNVAFGEGVMTNLTTGGGNTGVGDSALSNIVTGSSNISLGQNSGTSYTTSESSNIAIGNTGTAAESHVLRIGTSGSGSGKQNKCFIAGINGVSVSNPLIVGLNSSTGQQGTITILTSVNGGTGNGFTKFSGPTTSEKTFTLPDASESIACLGQANTFTKAQKVTPVAVTSSSGSIATDASLSNNFTHTLTENTTLANPTNLVNGGFYQWKFIQASSAKTLAFGNKFKFPGTVAMVISTGNAAVDILSGYYDSTADAIYCVYNQGFG